MTSDTDPSLRDKANILFRNGFLRHEDRADKARVESRWRIYQTVSQKTIRAKGKPEKAAAE